MRSRWALAVVVATALILAMPGLSGAGARPTRVHGRAHVTPIGNFIPAVGAQARLARYFVVMKAPAAVDAVRAAGASAGSLSPQAAQSESAAKQAALNSQEGAIRDARARGGTIVFRYGLLVNAFSARLSPSSAQALARRADVASVQPVSILRLENSTSVPFIGGPKVWKRFGVRGQGMTLALVDTGIDYTHKDFGGPGTVAAYENNDPNFVEPGTFPTAKVVGGYDFVGSNYDVLDDDPSNDIPRPDADPLDRDGHGTHTGGTCCGMGVPGKVGAGVAPKVKIRAYKVWDVGNSTDDVLVAGYERAVDPNQDGNTNDHADVISFSGGVDYGTLNSVEARAAQRAVDVGTVFVASAGNSGNQPSGGSAYITGTPANARGVISVAASIDQFVAQTLTIETPPTPLPDNGLMVHQDWSADLSSDMTDQIVDAREFDTPADPVNPAPTDRMLCDSTPPGDFAGHIALVYKGATGGGDCTGSEKVFRAQEMGASAVILWNGFGGFPSGLGPGDFVDQITIPAVMISTNDSETLGATISPDAGTSSFNTVAVTGTLHATPSVIPGFEDAMTDFTSEGPARLTNDLKPDISAPGFDITSAAVGTGDDAAVLSGTSMAAPHVSGSAVLLRQLHPSWTPGQIKALLMDQANRAMKNNDLSSPVPATVMGAGRVQVFQSATAHSLAWPGSLSFGLQMRPKVGASVRSFQVRNYDSAGHDYHVSGGVRYSDFDPAIATIRASLDGTSFAASQSFHLAPRASRRVWIRLRVDPSVISPLEQEFGWYYFHPNVDGTVRIGQNAPHRDVLRVAWHVAPLAVAKAGVSETSLDLTGGSQTMTMTTPAAAGVNHADLYLLGATDPVNDTGEEDIVAVGARSFTGAAINGTPSGLPTGTDPLADITWREFLTNDNEPTEPVEFGVQTASVHNTTETLEIDVNVDAGADGVFADPELQADYLVVKQPGAGGIVCVYDLSLADPFASCAEDYFADYSNYNANVVGLAVDAQAIGLTTPEPAFAYQVTACTGRFSGDVPGQFCDSVGSIDSGTGTYDMTMSATDPALTISPLVCGGFWSTEACDSGNPVTVDVGSAGPGDDPSILVLFPNNAPSRTPTIVQTQT